VPFVATFKICEFYLNTIQGTLRTLITHQCDNTYIQNTLIKETPLNKKEAAYLIPSKDLNRFIVYQPHTYYFDKQNN